MSDVAEVRLWGRAIAAVSLERPGDVATFEYLPEFVDSGIEVAPLHMPLSPQLYSFPGLGHASFLGLPGLLADCLPDRYGHALIDAWLAGRGRGPESFSAVERLCYVGRRGMGALEFYPTQGPRPSAGHDLQVRALVELASEVLDQREQLIASLRQGKRERAMREILAVGTSAGGARAKAVIAFDPDTETVRSGQIDLPAGFEHWLIKFDGVANNKDKDRLADPQGYGAIEFAYSRMAAAAGIQMSECRLLEEDERRHFMTRRFDRGPGGEKIHMQSLGALAHLDFNQAGAHSYEQAFDAARRLNLPQAQIEQLYRRMVFNAVARNQDDHVKNIAFLMDRSGTWSLSPAYDVTYAYRSGSRWTSSHQMTINGRRDLFTLADFTAVEKAALLPRGRGRRIVEEVVEVVGRWLEYADDVALDEAQAQGIENALRLDFPAR